ncbi:hypothetical protein ACYRFS_12950 [Listeria kieliensis]
MQPLKDKPDLSAMPPFQAIQTARANNMPLPDSLNMQLKQAKTEAQLYQLKTRMKSHYKQVLQEEREPLKQKSSQLFGDWKQEMNHVLKEISGNSKGKASQILDDAGHKIVKHESLLSDIKKGPKSIKSKTDLSIAIPSHPLLPLI